MHVNVLYKKPMLSHLFIFPHVVENKGQAGWKIIILLLVTLIYPAVLPITSVLPSSFHPTTSSLKKVVRKSPLACRIHTYFTFRNSDIAAPKPGLGEAPIYHLMTKVRVQSPKGCLTCCRHIYHIMTVETALPWMALIVNLELGCPYPKSCAKHPLL